MPKPYKPNDNWSKKAKNEGYRARSAYKLQELDEKFRLLKPGQHVLDIGAAPGSWLQYASSRIGPSGKILGLDLKEIEPVGPNIVTAVCDIADRLAVESHIKKLCWNRVDLVLSDIAPNTSGIADVDQWKSIELSQHALDIAKSWLKPGGFLVMKIFRGKNFDEFVTGVKRSFRNIKVSSVKVSRDRSREVYVVCVR